LSLDEVRCGSNKNTPPSVSSFRRASVRRSRETGLTCGRMTARRRSWETSQHTQGEEGNVKLLNVKE